MQACHYISLVKSTGTNIWVTDVQIYRSIETPLRSSLSTQEAWFAEDDGLITCWERGRQMAKERPELAAAAADGELVSLPWKGGLEQAIKAKRKYGTLRYLAMWQGLRGESLDIDTERERELFCKRFGVTVTYTGDTAKLEGPG